MMVRSITTGILLAAGAFAQMSSFPKPSYFRETFAKSQPKVELKDPVHLKDFVVGGKLELSLKNYLALVMSNNTDIQLQMLSLEKPKNAIQRAFGVWDPKATASFSSTRTTTPPTSSLDGASDKLSTLSQPLSMQVSQTLPEGLNYVAQWGGQKSTSSSSYNNYNPALSSNLSLTITQPLLQNRGSYVNRLNLMIARGNLKSNEFGLKSQLLTLVSGAESAYWDVVNARESLKVAEGARNVAAEFLKLSQKQLELGALSPLDIYNPEQQLASNEVSVAQARFTLQQREDALRKQIGVDLDPDVRKLPIVLTDSAEMNIDSLVFDTDQAIGQAMLNRPDLKQAVQALDVDDLSIQSARNSLLPNLALTGNYTVNGRGGIYAKKTGGSLDGTVPTVITTIPGGLSDALDQMFGFGYSSYQMGLKLTFPLRSRTASADMADALVKRKQDTLTLRNTQQAVRLDILNAISNVEGSKQSVKLAKVARDFAQKALDAENKKYELGNEILQNVLSAQNALAQSESAVVTNQISLRKNLLNLWVKLGSLLDERGIIVQ
jgi:outer membrane protein